MDDLLNELERAVYVSPTVDNMRTYIDVLEAHIEDLGDVQKELDEIIAELDAVRADLDKAADKIIEYENALGID